MSTMTFAEIYTAAKAARQSAYAALSADPVSDALYDAHDVAHRRVMRLDGLRIDAAKIAQRRVTGRALLIIATGACDAEVYAALAEVGVPSHAVSVATPDTAAQADEIATACRATYDVIGWS